MLRIPDQFDPYPLKPMPNGWPFEPSFETIKTIFKTIKSFKQNFETIKTVFQLRKRENETVQNHFQDD